MNKLSRVPLPLAISQVPLFCVLFLEPTSKALLHTLATTLHALMDLQALMAPTCGRWCVDLVRINLCSHTASTTAHSHNLFVGTLGLLFPTSRMLDGYGDGL